MIEFTAAETFEKYSRYKPDMIFILFEKNWIYLAYYQYSREYFFFTVFIEQKKSYKVILLLLKYHTRRSWRGFFASKQ